MLRSRWSGPFTILKVSQYGHVEIQNDKDGTKFTMNGQRLKEYLGGAMASSSNAARKRRGKAIAHEDDDFDALRFKSPFHQCFFNSHVASKPIIPDTRFNLEEGQYPHIQQQIELRGWKRLNKPKKRISQTIIR
ncbi:hypothetical protein PIB30_077283 [Stylosanthes scabra]|uniref:Uncharacterized protein n=1 Tax=Stylosanthes scabra TaxID=79078 RepID=A0ABU6ZP82_9FABA|nr:hypothetical protein [Stylosanthes scabra]